MDISDIKRIIEENSIHTVEVGFADLPGVLRGKRIPSTHFLRAVDSGFALCKAALAWDIQCDIFPGVDLASFDNGYPDLVARPLLDTFKPIPWREGSAFVLADVSDEHGHLVEGSPREVLKSVIKQANDLGYHPIIGPELEFYLLNADRKPFYEGVQCYSLYKGSEIEFVLEEIRNSVEAFGIHVEAANPEYGPAQVEINLLYTDALTAADNVLVFKNAVKEITRKHGLYATFMPKPWTGESGSGFHVHQSLWDINTNKNLFAEDTALADSYLAGLLSTAREFLAFAAPSVNAYKRYKDSSFAPTNVSWGYDNRTVSTRSLLGIGSASRLEHRTGSADANPYLIIAANIAAGLYGIKNKLTLPDALNENAYLSDAPQLPKTYKDALALLRESGAASEYFSPTFLDHFLTVGRHEVELFDSIVTDWEQARYLEMA